MSSSIGRVMTFVALILVIAIQIAAVFGSLNSIPYLVYLYTTAMYIILFALIVLELRRLDNFHIDRYALFTFAFSAVFRSRTGVVGEGYFLIAIGAIGVLCIALLFIHRDKIGRTNLRWAFAGLLVGGVLQFPVMIVQSVHLQLVGVGIVAARPIENFAQAAIRSLIYQLSFGVPIEEILFRGFLWGYLQSQGWTEKAALRAQAGLFWLAHWPKIFTPLIFLVNVPMILLASTWLAQRSKQVFPAIVSHAILNTASSLL